MAQNISLPVGSIQQLYHKALLSRGLNLSILHQDFIGFLDDCGFYEDERSLSQEVLEEITFEKSFCNDYEKLSVRTQKLFFLGISIPFHFLDSEKNIEDYENLSSSFHFLSSYTYDDVYPFWKKRLLFLLLKISESHIELTQYFSFLSVKEEISLPNLIVKMEFMIKDLQYCLQEISSIEKFFRENIYPDHKNNFCISLIAELKKTLSKEKSKFRLVSQIFQNRDNTQNNIIELVESYMAVSRWVLIQNHLDGNWNFDYETARNAFYHHQLDGWDSYWYPYYNLKDHDIILEENMKDKTSTFEQPSESDLFNQVFTDFDNDDVPDIKELSTFILMNSDHLIPEHNDDSDLIGKQKPINTMVVLNEIGDMTSQHGRDLQKRYSGLLNPFPMMNAPLPDGVFQALEEAFPWLTDANKIVARSLAINQYQKKIFKISPLLLIGPPGSGKTKWAKTLASILKTPIHLHSMAGIHSSISIVGTERGWSSHHPGAIPEFLNRSKIANPIVVFDEVDKASTGSHNGDPISALMPLLETETSKEFYDICLMGNLDLSKVTFIFTANNIANVHPALLSRVTIVHVDKPHSRYDDLVLERIYQSAIDDMEISSVEIPKETLKKTLKKRYHEHRDLRRLSSEIRDMIGDYLWLKNLEGESNLETERESENVISFTKIPK